MYNLIITEKKSVAESIAAVLNVTQRQDGFFQSDNYLISWCMGHLVELAQPDIYDERYAKWCYADLPIIPSKWKYSAKQGKSKQLKILSSLMKRADVECVICATDAGREGQLIFNLVYNYCGCTKPAKRLWINSMEKTAIIDGFKNLKDGSEYDRLYQSALCRSQADYIVGINSTRLFSILYNSTLHIGRVQTPTLALLAEREDAINAFVKEPFYVVELECNGFVASGDEIKDKSAAETISTTCDGKTATVQRVEHHEKTVMPPKLYDLTTLQREANRIFGYTAKQTLDYAQALYEKQLASYPRTDSRYLPDDMAVTLPVLVAGVAAVLPFVDDRNITIDNMRVIDNSKISDHHALIPTQTMTTTDLAALPKGELNILNMLAVRLLCAVGDKHVYNETSVTVECAGNFFKAKGTTVINNGWQTMERAFKASVSDKDDADEKALPDLVEKQRFENVHANVREGFTSPPKHFTEDTLLSAMECAGDFSEIPDAERRGLGTPATRAEILEGLVKRGFAERKGRQFLPTSKGMNLIKIVPEVLKSPALTAEWENKLCQIQKSELDADSFMSGIAELMTNIVKTHTAPVAEYVSLFPSIKRDSGNPPIGKCPRCNSNIYERKQGFFCDNRACKFALWRDNKFFVSQGKEISKEIAGALLAEGRVFVSGLCSKRTNKPYDATVIFEDTGEHVNFKLDFGRFSK